MQWIRWAMCRTDCCSVCGDVTRVVTSAVCQAGSTALMLAAAIGDASAATCLLEAGANVNACDTVTAYWHGLHDSARGREADGLFACGAAMHVRTATTH